MNNELSRSTSANSSATLRPRNRRLISVEDHASTLNSYDGPGATKRDVSVQGALSSLSSRAPSPIPSKHPSRSTSSYNNTYRSSNNGWPLGGFNVAGTQPSSSTSITGLLESSWSSVQGMASNLLGSDTKGDPSSILREPRRRRSPHFIHSRKAGSAPPAQWGPRGTAERQVGIGSREDRLAQVQARKRDVLLAANGHALPNSSGRFKRRDSDEGISKSTPPGDFEDRDALVYLHHVKPEDTLAGVMIKFNCQANVFRKANRLWPNDTIQVRKAVVLPIEACGVKGRKIPAPTQSIDLLGIGDGVNEDQMSTPTASNPTWNSELFASESRSTPLSSIPSSPSISISAPDEPAWTHDSWVSIEGHPSAVEIARLPRRTLGYFPPSRRKSQCYSDLDTPPASLDIPRLPSSLQLTDDNKKHSPRRRKSRSSSESFFASQLQGPGGVGTLGPAVRSPGPAQDGLNKMFAQHLPNVAPRTSFESTASTTSSSGLENVGGAIEGWVRKLATRAAQTIKAPPARGRSGVGDLIELSDAFEVGDDEDDGGGTNGSEVMTETATREAREGDLGGSLQGRERSADDCSRKKGD